MSNYIRGRTLVLFFVVFSLFSGQMAYSQVSEPATTGSAQAVGSDEATLRELNEKKLKLISFINSLEDINDIRKLHNFFLVHSEIMIHYVDETNALDLLDLAAKGMVNGLDPYSNLFIGKEAEDFYKSSTEEERYVGVGITITSLHKRTYVVEVRDGSSAAGAGLEPGDLILKVNNQNIYGLSTLEVSSLTRGPEGTSVVLEVKSRRAQKPKNVELTRRPLTAETVTFKDLGKGIVYAKIRSFLPAEEVVAEFTSVLERSAGKKLIIDIRGNGGGSLDAVNGMVGFLIGPGQTLITMKGREKEITTRTVASGRPIILPAKIVLLVDYNSASASEIMAGNLKHYKVATLVGVRTYGKAVAQRYLGLDTPNHNPEGSKLILGLTTYRYLLPDGTSITGNGVQPDVEVELPDDFKPFEYLTQRDLQFQEALKILKRK